MPYRTRIGKRSLLGAAGLVGLLSLAVAVTAPPVLAQAGTPPNFTVAFVGDQGVGAGAVAVLQLIADEGTDMVLHQGDLGYTSDADAWDQQITDVLGADFPYFASIGNHDCNVGSSCSGPGSWPDYQTKLQERLDKVSGAACTGDLGVNASCSYRGLFFSLSGAGTMGTGHADFIADALSADNSVWRICSWHKNQRSMQVGGKGDAVGWEPYEACREGGAIIATGHEHSYSRTHLMADFENQAIESTAGTLEIAAGQTFAFVSGIAGRSIRVQNATLAANPWWASVYTATQGATFGALFCRFNDGGVFDRAHCYFKDIDGTVVDEFDLVASSAVLPPPVPSLTGWAMAALGGVLLLLSVGRRVLGARAHGG